MLLSGTDGSARLQFLSIWTSKPSQTWFLDVRLVSVIKHDIFSSVESQTNKTHHNSPPVPDRESLLCCVNGSGGESSLWTLNGFSGGEYKKLSAPGMLKFSVLTVILSLSLSFFLSVSLLPSWSVAGCNGLARLFTAQNDSQNKGQSCIPNDVLHNAFRLCTVHISLYLMEAFWRILKMRPKFSKTLSYVCFTLRRLATPLRCSTEMGLDPDSRHLIGRPLFHSLSASSTSCGAANGRQWFRNVSVILIISLCWLVELWHGLTSSMERQQAVLSLPGRLFLSLPIAVNN